MKNKKKLDIQERKIILELIRNPRISDNSISKKTGVPLKTVNRKRKILESKNILSYYTDVDRSQEGTGSFGASHMYLITFKEGVSRKQFMDLVDSSTKNYFFIKHISYSFIGEKHGKLCLIMIIDSRLESDIIEIFNAEIIPFFNRLFGKDVIHSTETIRITRPTRLLHNYVPRVNQSKGLIEAKWEDSWIFVDD